MRARGSEGPKEVCIQLGLTTFIMSNTHFLLENKVEKVLPRMNNKFLKILEPLILEIGRIEVTSPVSLVNEIRNEEPQLGLKIDPR